MRDAARENFRVVAADYHPDGLLPSSSPVPPQPQDDVAVGLQRRGCPFGADLNRVVAKRRRRCHESRSPSSACRPDTRCLTASLFTVTAAAQSDQQPSHAELVQHWAEAALDAQLKGMKTSLRLTSDQEKDWASFESTVKDVAQLRVVALQKEQAVDLSPMDRVNAKAEHLAQSQEGLEKIVEAATPLYTSFSERQKHTFVTLGRMLVPEPREQ
jgi:hypothetical protein